MISSHSEQILVDDNHPWPGLASFLEQDENYFKGRDSDIENLLTLVRRARLSVLYGISGLGKSSLLLAGVFPRLRTEQVFPIYIHLDFSDKAASLLEQVFSAIFLQTKERNFEAPARIRNETLWEYFHRKDAEFWDDRNHLLMPLLCFDQFEEFFTIARENPQRHIESKQFLDELADLIEGRCPEAVQVQLNKNPDEARNFNFSSHPYKVILSLREDYLADLEGLRKVMPSLIQNRMRLASMDGNQALVVTDQTHGRLVEPSVAETIVRLIAGNKNEDYCPLSELRIEPALLSLVCHELNEKRILDNADKIDAQSVANNRAQIIENFYERCLKKQSTELRRFIEDKLITINGFRNSEAYDNALGVPGITPEDLLLLVKQRLLRLEERNGLKRIELIHDVLTDTVRKSRDQRLIKEEQRQAEEKHREIEKAYRATKRRAIIYLILVGISLAFAIMAKWEELRSDNLLGFMLGEKLQAELRDTGRGNTLELIQRIIDKNLTGKNFNKGLVLRNRGSLHYSHGEADEALRNYYQALEIFEKFSGDRVEIELARTLYNTGLVLIDQGNLTDAEKLYEQALKIRRHIVDKHSQQVPIELLEIFEQGNTPALDLAEILDALGGLYSRMGEVDASLNHYDEAISIAATQLFPPLDFTGASLLTNEFKSEPNVIAIKSLASSLINKYSSNYWFAADAKHLEQGLFLLGEYRRLRPMSAISYLEENRSKFWRAISLHERHFNEMLAELRGVITGFEALRMVDSDNLHWRFELLNVQSVLSNKLLMSCSLNVQACTNKDFALMEGERLALESIKQLRTLIVKDKTNQAWKISLISALFERAKYLKESKSLAGSMRIFDEAIEIFSQLTLDTKDADTKALGAIIYQERALVRQEQGLAEKALEDFHQARLILEDLNVKFPEHKYYRELLIGILTNEANLLKDNDAAVLSDLIKRKITQESLGTQNILQYEQDGYRNAEWDKQKKVVEETDPFSKTEIAIVAYQTAIKALSQDKEANPKQAAIWHELSMAQYGLAEIYRNYRSLNESVSAYRAAAQSAQEACSIAPKNDAFQNWLYLIKFSLAEVLRENKEYEAARDQFEDFLILMREAIKLNPLESIYYAYASTVNSRIISIKEQLQKNDNSNQSQREMEKLQWQVFYMAWKAMALSSNSDRAQEIKNLLSVKRDLAKFVAFEKNDSHSALFLMENVATEAEKSLKDNPTNPKLYCQLGDADYAIGMLKRKLLLVGWEESIRKGLLAIDWGNNIAQTEDDQCLSYSGSYRKELGHFLQAEGRLNDAKDEWVKALSDFQKLYEIAIKKEGDMQKDVREVMKNIEEIEILLNELDILGENLTLQSTQIIHQLSIPIPTRKPHLFVH